jgi:3-deoxy-D-manno-octulosonate 8-phosphate phosphatase KdsC-like HAD superfamily phosphatase
LKKAEEEGKAVMWTATNASQTETNAAHLAIVILHDYCMGKQNAEVTAERLWKECGLCSQTLVDMNDKVIGIRILSDTITSGVVQDCDFGVSA